MKKKVFFIISSLAEGGAEKVISILLGHLSRTEFCYSLLLFEKTGYYLKQIPPDIRIYDLEKKKKFSFLKLLFKVAKIVKKEKPNVVISFLGYTNLVCLLARKLVFQNQSKWVISERSLPSAALRGQRMYFLKLILHKLLARSADLVIVNSEGTKEELIENFGVKDKKIKIIPNPVEIEKIQLHCKKIPSHVWYSENVPILISVGRLSKPKGYPCLLTAFSEVLKEIECRLIILGEGEMRDELEILINRLAIKKNVNLLGFISNPYPYIAHSDIFVLPSLWEGQPNALLEAMALGKPVIATNCSKAVEEIIKNGENGFLISPNDISALKNTICRVLKNKSLQVRLGEENKDRIQKFDVSHIVQEYENVLSNESEMFQTLWDSEKK